MDSITTLYINSKNANVANISNFNYELINGINDCVAFYVKSVTIPYSEFVTIAQPIGGGNATFNLYTGIGPGDTVSLTPGNYTALQAGLLLQNAIQTAVGNTDITVTYNANTYQYTIAGGLQEFQLRWLSTSNNLPGQSVNYTFGFTGDTAVPGSGNQISNIAANMNGNSQNYYIRSRALSLGGCYSYFQNQKDNIIYQVPINVGTGGVLVHQDQNASWIYLSNSNISTIDLSLIDDFGNYVNTQGLNWTIAIVIKNSS
jgi:hypothetical protein